MAQKKSAAGKRKPPASDKLREAAGQTGSILKKILELADASVGLGVNVVSLLASVAQAQIGAKLPPEEGSFAGPAPQQGGDGRAAPPNYCVANRTPLAPGGAVRIPFSINNDLPQTTKRLVVSAHDFVGATQAFKLDDAAFSVEPSEKTIAPLDFEKFVLVGAVPADAPEDSYNGWILVGGDEQMKIPVVLMVSRPR